MRIMCKTLHTSRHEIPPSKFALFGAFILEYLMYTMCTMLALGRGPQLMLCSLAQMTVIDLQAMAMALACCWVPPLKNMNRHKPPPFTCSFSGLALVASTALALQTLHICLMLFLCTRPWFTGGNGTTYMVCNCTTHIYNQSTAFTSCQTVVLASLSCHPLPQQHAIIASKLASELCRLYHDLDSTYCMSGSCLSLLHE